MITSLQNEQIKTWRKLHKRKYRHEMNSFLVEGMHLIDEAIKSGAHIEQIIVQEAIPIPEHWKYHPLITVSKTVFTSLAQTEKSQGIIAVITMQKLEKRASGPVLLLDGLQDPGNVGTIIRTADAVGAAEVLIGKGTVDIYNEKVIRATQGSLFHIRITHVDLKEAITQLKMEDYTIWASALEDATTLSDAKFTQKDALIVGNEGSGISSTSLNLADQIVKVPIYGEAESLNVSVATGILLYEMIK